MIDLALPKIDLYFFKYDCKMTSEARKCKCCNKKVPLTTFPCRCGGLYCSKHSFSTEHSCKYDYRADSMKNLSSIMEKVVAKKLDVI